jgi:hypothetical protein
MAAWPTPLDRTSWGGGERVAEEVLYLMVDRKQRKESTGSGQGKL